MWRNTPALRGVVMTPTKLDRFDSIDAACAITRCGWSGCSSRWPPMSASSCDSVASASTGRTVSMVSTNMR